MHELLDIFIHREARSATEEAAAASLKARTSATRIDFLEERIDRLALVNEALWRLLKEKVGISDQEMLDRIQEVDLSDGRLDGRVRHASVTCPKCKRTIGSRHRRCIYCGETTPGASPLRGC